MRRDEVGLDRACPVCESRECVACLSASAVPVFCNVRCEDAGEAERVPRGTLSLVACTACGHLFNAAFDPARVRYGEGYENDLHVSPAFQGYARALARALVERHSLHGKRVLEVGSGTGRFLELLLEAGAGSAIGVDPSARPRGDGEGPRIHVHVAPFGEGDAAHAADFVACRHVLEHLASPRAMLAAIAREARGRALPVYLEVPDADAMLRDEAIWDLIYEHASYFGARSLGVACAGAGIAVDEVVYSFGGQYLGVHATAGGAVPSSGAHGMAEDAAVVAARAAAFGRAFHEKRARWGEALDRAHREGRRVAVWGAGSKGVTFVNLLDARASVDCVVDTNPSKQGGYVPGTGHPIVAPADVAARGVDLVVLMNPVYRQEVVGTLAEVGARAEVRVAR